MKHTLLIAAIAALAGGVAYADHGHGGGGGGGGHGPVIRDHREGGGGGGGGPVVRDHRGGNEVVVREHERGGGPVIRDHRGPVVTHVRMSGGRYVFPGGVVRTYHHPVIREHYYNARVRPAIVVEEYDPVPGYAWVRGSWAWGGGEWVWNPGYWAVEAAPAPVMQGPVVSGGVSVSAGVSF